MISLMITVDGRNPAPVEVASLELSTVSHFPVPRLLERV